ncbi:MAG: PAS domain-containing protein, partial [Burkholderiales bacterium]|nr:PAS domain-containing protein [Burkholderiales bacterium]
MSILVFAAWLLAIVFSVILASWGAGAAAIGLTSIATIIVAVVIWFGAKRDVRRSAAPGDVAYEREVWSEALVNAISVPAIALDGNTVVMANKAFLDLLGYAGRGDQIVGLHLTNLVHPIDHAAFAELCADAGRPASQSKGTLRLVRADDFILKVQVSLAPLEGLPGKVLLQMVRDDAAPMQSAKTDRTLELMVGQLALVLFQIDRGCRIERLTPAWERLSGRTTVSSAGLRLASLIHPEDRDSIEAALTDLGHGRLDHMNAECRFVTASGAMLWVRIQARPYTQENALLVGAVGSIAEMSGRFRSGAAMRSNDRYLDTLLANVPGMVFRSRNDPEWTMEFVSDGCFDLTGYDPLDLVDNQRVTFGSLIHPDDKTFVWAQVQSHLAQRKPYVLAYRIRDARGNLRWVWDHGRGVFSAHGEFLAIEGFISDVSEHRGSADLARSHLWLDASTGMLSHEVFSALLSQLWRHAQIIGYRFAVLVVDVIGLPALLERIGGAHVERAMEQLVRRLTGVSEPAAVVCSLGGHEFAVLVTDFRLGGMARAVPDAREIQPVASLIAGR